MAFYSHELIIQIYFVKSFVTNFTLNLLLYLTCITNFTFKWLPPLMNKANLHRFLPYLLNKGPYFWAFLDLKA